MPKKSPPLFLARRAYRRRRMMDGARILPLFGAILFLVPALWQPAQTPEPDTARGAVYLFGIWSGLILAALALARGLSAALNEEDEESGGTYLDQPERGGLGHATPDGRADGRAEASADVNAEGRAEASTDLGPNLRATSEPDGAARDAV